MKKSTLILLTFILPTAAIAYLAPRGTYATPLSHIQVDRIDHVVVPVYGGLLIINDTIRISPATENLTVENFSIGFPLEYRANLRFSTAYDADNSKQLEVILDTGVGAIGYYGVTVVFPDEVRDLLYSGQSYTFTVIFGLSDLIDSSPVQVFTIDFPAYPSLAQEASTCNVTVILPKNSNYTGSDFPFNSAVKDEQVYLSYIRNNLPRLTRISAEVSFLPEDQGSFAIFSANKLTRTITIDAKRHISIAERFVLESRTAFTVGKIRLKVPGDAGNVSAYDEQDREITTNPVENETGTYELSLDLPENQSRSFRLVYDLQGENHLIQLDGQRYQLDISLSENLSIMPETFILKIIFPEGASIQSFPQQAFNVHRDVFQEELSLSFSNITWLQDEQWSFIYSYTVFWTSFRPTLWATALVIIGSIIAFAWQRPKAPAPVSIVLVPRETLDEFVETYEEKKKILSGIEEIKEKVQKGKISRRRYKVRKKTLENKLSSLSKRLTDMRQKIVSAGARYADAMRQLEVAEIELDNIEADIRRIEIRFKRGEISAQTYRRLLENDLRRQEKARTTIDGVLLRLRE